MDKTSEIFCLVVAETIVDGRHGLSANIATQLAGCAGQHAESEAEFVQEVLSQSECFTQSIESLIETVHGGDSDSKESDLLALNTMLNWKFDAKQMEMLAGKDWREY